MAADLVRRQMTVIVAAPTPSAQAAKAATTTIPFVFSTGADPVEIGLVTSLNRPDGNVTGVTNLDVQLGPKQLEFLHGSALSWSLGWPTIPGLPLPLLGIVLVALAFIPPVWAFILFRREDTEINPTSLANRKLVTRGAYQFTRNPMNLGLVTLSLGIAVWISAWPMFMAPLAAFATVNFVHIPFGQKTHLIAFSCGLLMIITQEPAQSLAALDAPLSIKVTVARK
jgi:hypothetical protein